MKLETIEKLTKEQIESFIMGVQECTERGDLIDTRKNLIWIVTEIENVGFNIKAEWIKSVTRYPLNNPMTDRDDDYHYDDYFFHIIKSQSKRKLCAEICDAIDYVNSNEFKD